MTTSETIGDPAIGQPATCAYPGCGRPVRQRAGDGGGKPPRYCDLTHPHTGKLAHTPLTAARARDKATRAEADGPDEAGETPASAARTRAAGLLEQFQAAAGQMSQTLQQAVASFQAAGDPDSVSAELTAARRARERTQWEADERISTVETARDQAAEEAAAARSAAADAAAARDEAIAELETVETRLAEAREELAGARREHAAELNTARGQAAAEIDRIRGEADQQTAAAETAADQRAAAAEAVRDQATAEAAAARQAAADAATARDQLRSELEQVRTQHRDELAAARREHREELAADRARADTALAEARADHQRETQALQRVLDSLTAASSTVGQPAGGKSRRTD